MFGRSERQRVGCADSGHPLSRGSGDEIVIRLVNLLNKLANKIPHRILHLTDLTIENMIYFIGKLERKLW
jgi:hypothetical protein